MTLTLPSIRQVAALFLILQFALHSSAQEVERHETEELTRAEVGPYQPEQFPELRQVEQLITEGANRFRKEQELDELALNEKLTKAATAFAQFMADNDLYGHHADGKSPAQRVRASGYDYCLVVENIAWQFQTAGFKTEDLAKVLVEGWKKSPPHRKNVLDQDVLETGVGIAQSKNTGVFYAVQLFGRPKSAAIHFAIANQTPSSVDYKIGDRTFSLPGHYTRRHSTCRAEAVQLVGTDGAEGAKPVATTPLTPSGGDQFVIDIENDRLTIKQEAVSRTE